MIPVLFFCCANFGGIGVNSSPWPPEQDLGLAPVKDGGKHTVLTQGELWGRLLDNVGNEGRQGSGFNPLLHIQYPANPIFITGATGLNFEHIFNGAAADNALAMFTPRNDPVELIVHSRNRATLYWPAKTSSWAIESAMTYTFVEPDIIDMTFRTTPTEDRFPNGYIAYMWASYMACARDRRIHFRGLDAGKDGWTAFGEELSDGQIEMGTVACAGVEPLTFEEKAQALNIVESQTKRFTKPFYYGLLDPNRDGQSDLAYVMMFDQAEPIRFAMWNFISDAEGKPDTRHPAWDWQYVVREPQVGREYGYKARLVIREFEDRQQVERLYDEWREEMAADDGSARMSEESPRHRAQFAVGELTCAIGDNAGVEGHLPGYNGLFALWAEDDRATAFVPAFAGWNLEHYFDARLPVGEPTIFFEPRTAPMRFERIDDATARLSQPVTPHFGVESRSTFTLREPHYIDFEFECVAHQKPVGGFLGAFWASYILDPTNKGIYFLESGSSLAKPRWVHFLTQQHNRDSTVLPDRGAEGMVVKHDDFPTLFSNLSPLRYAEPFFFGRLRDKVLIYIFERGPHIRFAHSPVGGGPTSRGDGSNPAWDFQFLVPDVQPGHEYGFRARLVYKTWQGLEDVLAEVRLYYQDSGAVGQ